MQPNKHVLQLRREGKRLEAIEFADQALQQNPNDAWLKGARAWLLYDDIKDHVAIINTCQNNGQAINHQSIKAIQDACRTYARFKLQRPDMVWSQITRQLCNVAANLDFFIPFLIWSGIDSFGDEDFTPYQTEKGVSPCLLSKTARSAVAWRLSHPHAEEHDTFILNLLAFALANDEEADGNRIWLLYDRVKLFNATGQTEAASKQMREVLAKKPKEFWAWAEAARIERPRNPELAIACFCQAMLCRPDPKFTGKLHLELAELLVEQGNYPQAISEYLAVAAIHQEQGWPFPKVLEGVMQASWFDSSLAADRPQAFYKMHHRPAQRVLYESVQTVPASFIKTFRTKKSDKLMALIALKDGHEVYQRVLPSRWQEHNTPTPGAPLEVSLGALDDRQDILDIDSRKGGRPFDSLATAEGVVTNIKPDGSRGGVYLGPKKQAVLVDPVVLDDRTLTVGDTVRASLAANPAHEGRLEAFALEKLGALPDIEGITTRQGLFRLNPKGFGFVDDVFVPPPVAIPSLDQQPVAVLCIEDFDDKKNKYGWKAVKMSPSNQDA